MSKKLTVTLVVDAAAAARLGRTNVGEHQMVLDDEDLAAWTPGQREALARHFADSGAGSGSEPRWGHRLDRHAPDIGEVTVDVLAELLDLRTAVMAKQEAEKKAGAEKKAAKQEAELKAYSSALLETVKTGVKINTLGAPMYSPRPDYTQITYLRWPGFTGDAGYYSEELANLIARRRGENEEALRVATEPVLDAARLVDAARKAADKIERKALLERLPGMRRARLEEGYGKVDEALRQLIRGDLREQLPDVARLQTLTGAWMTPDGCRTVWTSCDQLSDYEYATVVALREIYGDDAIAVRDATIYRDADDGEECDDDGEVLVSMASVARVTVTRGDVETTLCVLLA